jgi:hypothetical protein
VAVATGGFGTHRMAALDAEGEVVAGNRRPVTSVQLTARCPGGRSIATYGYNGKGEKEVAVYALPALRLRHAGPST